MSTGSKKLSFFDFIQSINTGLKGENLFGSNYSHDSSPLNPDAPDKQYVPFMVNRGLSQFSDTIMFANEMNFAVRAGISGKMQYDFLRAVVRPRKRFGKWAKGDDDSELVNALKRIYNYNSEKAREIIPLLSEDQQKQILQSVSEGGKSK